MFLKIGHAIKAAALKIAGEMPAVQAEMAKIAPTVEDVSNLLLKGSGDFEAHLLDVWGVVAKAVKDAGDVAGANGLGVIFDQNLIADVKGFLPAVEAYLHPSASPAAPGQPPLAAAGGVQQSLPSPTGPAVTVIGG